MTIMPLYELYHTTTQLVHESFKVFTIQEVAILNEILREQRSPLRYVRQHEAPAATCTCGAEYQFECVCELAPADTD